MNDRPDKEFALDPQDLERLLVLRQNLGDVEGMAALYEADAVLVDDDGRRVVGKDAIRDFFTELIKSGKKFQLGTRVPHPCGVCKGGDSRFAPANRSVCAERTAALSAEEEISMAELSRRVHEVKPRFSNDQILRQADHLARKNLLSAVV